MRNLSMMTDLYQLTMMYGYYRCGIADTISVFDVFFRKPSGNSTYALLAGIEQVVDYINHISFTPEDIEYLRSQNLFNEDFLSYLSNFKFTGEIYSMPEGTVVFPHEPLLRIKAPVIQAQLLETTILNIVNHQTLIATKASRIVQAAQGDAVLEFGLRRAQGPDAGIYGARASIIGGCVATSNVLAGRLFDVPIRGTHAHSWVMFFPSELDAFRAYAEIYPDSCMLLVDTYDTLRSGIPNAITVFRELRAKGYQPVGIRLDSGDLAYLSKKARQMLNDAGFPDVKIFASNDLDEELISDLKLQGAAIDVWGVGTRMITGNDCPALGGVYKLSAQYTADGTEVPKIKISENPEKITNPCYKMIYRLYDNVSGKAIADLITCDDEVIDESQQLVIFDPEAIWKKMTLTNFTATKLLQPLFLNGECVYSYPTLQEIRRHAVDQLEHMWDEYKRFTYPHVYKVDLSDKLFEIKANLLKGE